MAFTFGSTTSAANLAPSGGFGHQRSNTSLFSPASATPSSGFGTAAANSTGTFGTSATQNQQPSIGGGGGNLFGSVTQTSTGSPSVSTATSQPATGLFSGGAGATSAPNQTNALFGSSAATTPSQQPGLTTATTTTVGFGTTSKPAATSLFGSNATGSGLATKQPTGLFAASTNTQGPFGSKPNNTSSGAMAQPLQQQNSLLSLSTVFPDTSVPHFIVKPGKVERYPITSNMFEKEPKAQAKELDFNSTTLHIGGRRTALPRFLTATQSASNSRERPAKRSIDNKQDTRSIDAGKDAINNEGIFGGTTGRDVFGNRSRIQAKEDNDAEEVPPTASLWDIGVNPQRYTGSINDVDVAPHTDLWTASIMGYSQTPMNKSKTISATDRPESTAPQQPALFSGPAQTNTIVRVFGFLPDHKSAVVRYFSQIGRVQERFQSTSNWITFRYTSDSDAKKALACHGELIDDNCRVGVILAKTMAG